MILPAPYTAAMSQKDFDPLRLDVAAFAKLGGELSGRWPLGELDRLTESTVAEALTADAAVDWQARGESRSVRGAAAQVWLHLAARTRVPLECQRCLKPVEVPLEIESHFLFVHGEDAAAQLDADSEDDVLALTRALDLRELTEDELLLSTPIVPRHEACPEPLEVPHDPTLDDDGNPNPFAALAAIKRPRPPN